MSKRFKIRIYIFVSLTLLLVLVPAAIIFIFFPPYRTIDEGIVFLLSGGLQLYTGFKQMQIARRMEKPILWWKSYSIIFGLMWICFGGLFLLVRLIQTNHQFNNILGSSVGTVSGILFVLLILALFIYGFILVVQQTVVSKKT